MKQRLILIGAGLVLLAVVVRLLMSRPGGDDVAVDTTGASAQAPAAGQAPPGPQRTPATAGRTVETTGVAKPTGPTPTPIVVQIQGTAVSIAAKPLVLLNPGTVRQGSSVGVTDWTNYLKKNTTLWTTGKDIFSNSYGAQTVDSLPKVPTSTYNSLSDVADPSFWSPYGP